MFDLLFPGRTLNFESRLSLGEIASRLQHEVTPPAVHLWDRRRQLFEGTFANGRFHMMRLVHGRNSFRPVIDGQLFPGAHGVRIVVRMRLHTLVLAICIVLATIAGTIAALVASALPVVGGFAVVARVLAMAAVLVLISAAAAFEARKSTRLLATLFEAEPSRSQAVPEPLLPDRS